MVQSPSSNDRYEWDLAAAWDGPQCVVLHGNSRAALPGDGDAFLSRRAGREDLVLGASAGDLRAVNGWPLDFITIRFV